METGPANVRLFTDTDSPAWMFSMRPTSAPTDAWNLMPRRASSSTRWAVSLTPSTTPSTINCEPSDVTAVAWPTTDSSDAS